MFKCSGTDAPFERPSAFKKNDKVINGLDEYELSVREHIQLADSKIFSTTAIKDGNVTQLNFSNLRPGTVVAVRVSLYEANRPHFNKLEGLIDSLLGESGPKYDELKEVISKLNLLDLNRAIYRCDTEERDMGNGTGAYDIPGFGPLVYCGSQGFVSLLTEIAPNNDLGHPFCTNLRDGDWMLGKWILKKTSQ